MSRTNMPIPKDPKQCQPWLYEYLKRLTETTNKTATGIAQVARGEIPDGSGLPLPNPDLSGFFLLAGRAGGQIGRGGTAASETLQLSSTASTTKGKIHLGYPTARLTVDETLKTVGINKTSPTATMHILQSDQGSGTAMFTAADIDATGTRWVARTGSGGAGSGSTIAAALANDDGLTTYGSINTASSGNNPQRCTLTGTVVPGATYLITAKITTLFVTPVYGGGNQNFWDVSLIDSAGNEWLSTEGAGSLGGASFTEITAFNTFATITRTVVCSGSPQSTGNTPNSINLVAGAQISHAGGGDLYIATTYVTVAQSGSPLAQWDFSAGSQSGQIDIFGRLGINTGSTTLGAEVDVVGTSASIPVLRLKPASSQTADIVQIRGSTDAPIAAITSRGAWAGHTDIVMDDDEAIGYEDDTVYYY